MTEQTATDGPPPIVSLKELSAMTGFPENLISSELLIDHLVDEGGCVHLDSLRMAMVRYLNLAVMNEQHDALPDN